ncbi:hypothetical protein CN425_18675 [Bacillus cereus]|uniref:Uncharacterized protein n=1 Tax=Bacillus cereus TaxID=1396 RepID=A0A2A8PTB1_BACCE|nr:hypothetical protein [Bacillus cereus]PEV99794.1 hypothetical protein CN425_18675 [Bacillus cereus]
MRHYFVVEAYYKQNGELHKSETYISVNVVSDETLENAMKQCKDTTREAYTRELANVDGELIGVTSREVSEIEYKRYALSEQAKRGRLQHMRGVN